MSRCLLQLNQPAEQWPVKLVLRVRCGGLLEYVLTLAYAAKTREPLLPYEEGCTHIGILSHKSPAYSTAVCIVKEEQPEAPSRESSSSAPEWHGHAPLNRAIIRAPPVPTPLKMGFGRSRR